MSTEILFKDQKGKEYDLTKFRTFIPDNIRDNVVEGLTLNYDLHILYCSIDEIYEAFENNTEFKISRRVGLYLDQK